MIRFAICDDDGILCDELKKEIIVQSPTGREDQIDLFQDGDELMRACEQCQYDAVFLDVHMKEVNGFDVARALTDRKYETNLIFITSDYALVYESFDFSPFYFLKKDNYREVLPKVLEKLERHMQQSRFLEVESAGELKHLALSEIYYIESDRHNVVVHPKRYAYSIRRKISELEEELSPYDFIRIQKGYLVNLKHVIRINMATEEIELKNQTVLKMSRRSKANVEQAFRIFQRRMNVI